jgi:uncharacterized glyoxalase superfamily protein PhnB
MTATTAEIRVSVIPSLRYRNAPAAIDWLCQTFGFKKHLIVGDENGVIHHAELTLGNGMIMVGSAVDSDFGQLMGQPDEFGGRETQCSYLIVPDADAVYAQAQAMGARIVREIRTEDYGGRGFGCYDLEGHLWYIGTYDPWKPAVGG